MNTTLIGNENKRTVLFGRRHRVAVTFTRVDGLWHAHAALLLQPKRNIRNAVAAVKTRLEQIATAAQQEECE